MDIMDIIIYKTDVIYKTSDGQYFVSPDGIGRYFYGTLAEAIESHDDMPVRRATKREEE